MIVYRDTFLPQLELLKSRFEFGKWNDGGGKYIGRSITKHEDCIEIDQKDEILEDARKYLSNEIRIKHEFWNRMRSHL